MATDLVTCADCGTPNVDPDWHRCETKPLPGQPSLLDAGEVFAEEKSPAEVVGENLAAMETNRHEGTLAGEPGLPSLVLLGDGFTKVERVAEPLALTLSVSRKVNLGLSVGSVEVHASVANVTKDTTEAEIAELLGGVGAVAWRAVSEAVIEKARGLAQ